MIKAAAVFLFLSHCVLCIDFQHDSTSVLDSGGTVRIVCDIGAANFTTSVTLLKDGSSKTVCDNANTCAPSKTDSNRYQYTSNASAVTVEIFNLTQPSDDGLWTCNLGSISSANYSLTVSSLTTTPIMESTTVMTTNSSSAPVNPGNGDKCLLLLYALLPIDLITLFGTIIVIVVACCLDKDGKLSESSMEESCGCCPHKNKFCMCMCPLCTDPLCTGSKKTDSSVILKNIISVVGFTLVAVIIGLIIAYGLGLDSGKCIPALILSIICGLALVAIFTVSVYPHWPCLPEKGENGGSRIGIMEDTKKTGGDQGRGRQNPTGGRSPLPLGKIPAIGNESTLNTKEMGTPLPVPPISKKLLSPIPKVQTVQTEDTVDEEEKLKKRKKKKKNKKREGEENGGDDKRDSQNSGGQANVEEEEE